MLFRPSTTEVVNGKTVSFSQRGILEEKLKTERQSVKKRTPSTGISPDKVRFFVLIRGLIVFCFHLGPPRAKRRLVTSDLPAADLSSLKEKFRGVESDEELRKNTFVERQKLLWSKTTLDLVDYVSTIRLNLFSNCEVNRRPVLYLFPLELSLSFGV